MLNEIRGTDGESAVQIKQWVLITEGLSEGSLAEWILMALVTEMKRQRPCALHQHITTGNDPAGNEGGRDSSYYKLAITWKLEFNNFVCQMINRRWNNGTMTQSNYTYKLSNCKLQTECHIFWGRLLSKAPYCSMTAYISSSEDPAGNQTLRCCKLQRHEIRHLATGFM